MATTTEKLDSIRRRRPDTRPAEIMEAALATFTNQGFRATTLDQVAEAAGVTKGAIYHYFKGKEDLLLQSLKHWMHTSLDFPDHLTADDQGPASARLRLLVRHMWKTASKSGVAQIIRLVEGELVPDHPEIMARWTEQSVEPMFELLSSVMEDGKHSGEFRNDIDTPVVVRFIVLGLAKIAVARSESHFSGFLQFEEDRIIDSILDVLFRGLRTNPSI